MVAKFFSNQHWWLSAMTIALVALLYGLGAQAQEVCNGDLVKLRMTCREFVMKDGPQKNPTKECCDVIKKADMSCCCANIPKEAESIISMEKVVYINKYCGKPLKSGTKCGSYTIPMLHEAKE